MTQPTNDGRNGPLPPAGLQHADADREVREDLDGRDPDTRDAVGRRVGDRDLLGREDDRLDSDAERDEARRENQDRTVDPDYSVEDDPNVISLEEQKGDGDDDGTNARQRQAEERLAEGYDDHDDDRDRDGDRDLDRDRNRDGDLLDGDRDRRDDGLLDGDRDRRDDLGTTGGGAHRADVPVREGDGVRDEGLLDRDRDAYGDNRGNPGPEEDFVADSRDLRRDGDGGFGDTRR